MLLGFQHKIGRIGVLVALVFAVNLLAAIPNQTNELNASFAQEVSQNEHASTHPVPTQKAHDHVKMCGVHTCNFRIEEEVSISASQFSEIIAFSALESRLDGLQSSPPKEPPKV